MEKYIKIASDIVNEVRKVVVGKDNVIIEALTAILGGGHILLEDIPGVGKTTLALAFAKSMSLEYNRLQFTPDVLPTDVTGFTIYNSSKGEFEYKSGAVLCNLFLADEINRTSSKTQSALLEVMEEGKVTVDGVTRPVKEPFVVIATQNPVGSVGTQKLPESQLDRFMVRLSMGYPDMENEVNILKGKQNGVGTDDISAVATKEDVMAIREFINGIYVADEVYKYITSLVSMTRNHPMIELGISPRGSIALAAMTRANAFMHGRNYAIPNDVKEIFYDVCAHRILINQKGKIARKTERNLLEEILAFVAVPDIKE